MNDPLASLWVWCCRSRCPVIANVHVCDGEHLQLMFGPAIDPEDNA